MYLGETGTQIITVDTEDQCKAAGGTVVGFIRQGSAAHDRTGRLIPGNVRCAIPPAQTKPASPSAPITVTVSPQIQAQVSPQISPVLQQQFQPSGSPAVAATTQAPAPSGITSQSQQLPPAPAPVPQAAPSYTPAPAPIYAPLPEQQLPPMPAPVPEPASTQISIEPIPSTPVPFDWKIPAIIGAGLIGILALSKRK
jgi:hypothetical protein